MKQIFESHLFQLFRFHRALREQTTARPTRGLVSHRLGLTESPLTRHPTLTVTSGCCTAETQLRPYSPGHKHKLDRTKHTTAFSSPAGYTQEVCNAPGVRNAPGVSHHHSQGANARTTQQYLKTKEGQFTLSLTGMKKK